MSHSTIDRPAVRMICPSRKFVSFFWKPANLIYALDRPWQWIGKFAVEKGHYGLRRYCGCDRLNCLAWSPGEITHEPVPIVDMTFCRIHTNHLERTFVVGQCSRCDMIHWGLVTFL